MDMEEFKRMHNYQPRPQQGPGNLATGQRERGGQGAPASQRQKPKFMEDGEDFVRIADEFIKKLKKENGDKWGKLTTSKIRNILSITSEIYNRLRNQSPAEQIDAQTKREKDHLKIRLVYEAGRAKNSNDKEERIVARFIEDGGLIEALEHVSTNADFIRYAKYLEALVAYHRFYGGKD